MADTSNVLGKKKKAALPPGWVERFTKKHPDKPYYFNEDTGESRWTPPVNEVEKTMDKLKGRKRKARDDEDEAQLDPPVEAKNSNDTPAMRLYREKMAQRKAAQEAKKSTPRSKANLNQTVTPQKTNGTVSATTPSVQKRLRRSSVMPQADNDSASSDGSVASMGSKIKQLVKAAEPVPEKKLPSSSQSVRKLPKIPKVKIVRAVIPASSGSVSDYGTMSDTCPDNVSMINPSDFGTPKTRGNSKNLANERLETFRKSLDEEKNKQLPNKRTRRSVSIDINENDSEMIEQSKLLNSPLLVLRSKVQSRVNNLEKRVQKNYFVEMNRVRQVKIDEEEDLEEKRLQGKYEATDAFCEQMDWEPIEDEKITSEVYTVRLQLCEKPAQTLSELSNHVINSGHVPKETNALYVIVDTNVFLSNLPFVEEVRDSYSAQFGRPFIVVPWTVLQELDYIKDDKDNSRSHALKLCARRAVDFLNRHFSSKHPRFLGQLPTDVERNKERFMIDCPDDEILQTCLQVKDSTRTAVLLSYDKNLCTKAMFHDIHTIGRDDSLEKICFLKKAETTDFLSNSLHARIEEKAEDVSLMQKEMLEAEDIMEEGKAHMQSVLSAVVKKEMEVIFGNRWEMHVIIRPPWSVNAALKCALKHWIAAVQESFTTRRTELMLRDLLELIKNVPEAGRKLPDVQHFLDKCLDIVQNLQSSKYPELKVQAQEELEALKQRCKSVIKELNSERLKLTVGAEPDAEEQERRAFGAFKVLEELYNWSRDICGMASEALGLQCSVQYNKVHPFLTPKFAVENQKDVGVNVNRLAQALEESLSCMNDGVQPNDRIVHHLYEIIKTFSSDRSTDELATLTPLDLFCCLKHRKSQIEKGIDQLQELCVHFARIANHRCTS